MPTPSADGSTLTGPAHGWSAAAALRLVRWPNALIAAAAVPLGAAWAGEIESATWLATVGALALTAVANSVNDVHDVEIDRLAHPLRPLPSGAMTTGAARRLAGVSALVGVAAAAAASAWLGALSAIVVAAMLWYSVSLKARRGVAANALVALLASLPFFYGAWTAGRPVRGLALVALAVPLHFAREVAKDLDDAAADAPIRRTLPVVAGARAARWTVVAATVLFAGVTIAFFARGAAPPLLVALCALACAAAAVRRVLSADAGAPRLFKGSMLLAMTALAIAAFQRPS